MHMQQKQKSAELFEVSKFYYHKVSSNLFFQPSLAKNIDDYYDACFQVASVIATSENRNILIAHLKTEKDLYTTINKKILSLFESIH